MFTQLQLHKIVLGLHKWYVPIKYSYITKNGATAWKLLEENKTLSHHWTNYDAELMLKTIELYISELEVKNEITIFDFGSWVGNTVIPTLKYLIKKWLTIHYHAFDISENIISLLKNNFKSHNISIQVDYTIIDFEEKDVSETIFSIKEKYNNAPVFGLFLGNTIWNFTSIERVLSNIMDSLSLKDKLLIGIERVDIQNERWLKNMLNWYSNENSYTHDFSTLEYIWFKKEYWRFEILFNRRNLSVENYFIFMKDFTITINNTILSFLSWEKIKIFHSKKINEEQLAKIFTDLDLRICNLRTSKDNLYLQCLVENKRVY